MTELKTFCVEFWWATDLRTDKEIKAFSEVQALSIALNDIKMASWVTDENFEVRIQLVKDQ